MIYFQISKSRPPNMLQVLEFIPIEINKNTGGYSTQSGQFDLS